MNKLKHFFVITCLLILGSKLLNAQKISGKIIDAQTKEPIPYANITLEKLPIKRVIAGGTTDLDGTFKFEAPINNYNLIISVLGYERKTVPNIRLFGTKTLDAGNIALKSKELEISEVKISAQRSYIENQPGKQILNVGREIAGGGGNVSQVLKIVPSVEVTPRGAVSIRGNQNIKILINGKEMTYGIDPAILLKQLPSSTVEKIEVITNASVKDDPESAGGAINIILKKNSNDGFHYGINLEAGMKPFRGNGGFNMNYAKNKLNTYLTYGAYVDNYDFSNVGIRKISDESSPYKSISDNGNGIYKDVGHLILGGIDYDVNEKTKLNLEFTHNQYKENWAYELTNTYLLNNGDASNASVHNRNKDNIRFSDVSFRLESEPKEKHQIKALLHFSGGKNKGRRSISELGNFYQEPTNSTIHSNATFLVGETNLDYKFPLTEKSEMEVGINNEGIDYRADQLGKGSYAEYKKWDFNQQKHASYALYKIKLNKLTLGAGIRPEYFKSRTIEKVNKTDLKQEYFKVYPNLLMNYNLGNDGDYQNISLSYSKRIRRPEANELDPVADYANPSHIYQGNPELKPEFINTVEFGYSRIKGQARINLNLFASNVNNVIQQQTQLQSDGTLFTTYINHSSSQQLGVEFNGKLKPHNKWETTLGGSYMKSFYADSKDINDKARRHGNMWQLKWDNYLSINSKNTIQLQTQYYGKTKGMYYTRRAYNLVNIGYERKILKSIGTLGLSINDVFNSGGKEYYKVFGNGFNADSSWQLNSRTFRLTFNFYIN